jgi:hypothetical protein
MHRANRKDPLQSADSDSPAQQATARRGAKKLAKKALNFRQ